MTDFNQKNEMAVDQQQPAASVAETELSAKAMTAKKIHCDRRPCR
jgi:hypothetical protein